MSGKATLLAAETPPPDRQQALLDAVSAAQKKLADAVQAKKPADAEVAAQDVEKALAAYRAEPTPTEIVARSGDLGAWLRSHKPSSGTDPVSAALVNLALDIASYRGEPTSTEIAVKSSDLGAWLRSHKPPSGTDPVGTALVILVQDIATYRGLGKPDLIGKAAPELSNWITATNWGPADNTKDPFDLAEAIMLKMRVVDPDKAAASFGKMAKIMVGTEASTPIYRPPFERVGYANDMKSALLTLNDPVARARPVDWFTTQATQLRDLFGGADATAVAATLPRRTLLQNDPKAMDAAKAAKETIVLLQSGYRPQIHIVDALYGDLPTGRYSKRVCNATRTMISKCERKDSCHLDDGYKLALCGYDPIPAADDRTRAVAVQYACFTGGDAVWDRLASHPLEDPFEYSDLTNIRNPATGFAILRGTTMELRCPFDANAPTVTK
ncbi:hypothetical protein [Mesorhizobium sp. GbtcB19]|uniref:hypothetical protein n=1 Tax=Mesorhizobium sp. GbtcB19 TaxID=2824764 RepID=UPI001C2FD0F9|nr:hypothetical protein [Mesorhizobium sp. GbtcB19]